MVGREVWRNGDGGERLLELPSLEYERDKKFGLCYEMHGIPTYSTYSTHNGGKKTNVMDIYHLGSEKDYKTMCIKCYFCKQVEAHLPKG